MKLADPSFIANHVDNAMFSELLSDIMQKYPDDIEEMHSIVAYIDGEFETKSSYWMEKQFQIFTFGYFIPIVMQQFFVENHDIIIGLCCMCLVSQLFSLFIESN